MPTTIRDLVDELDVLDLTGLSELGSPCVSFYLPTGRTHLDAPRAVLELRSLVDEAARELASSVATEEIGQILERPRALLDDRDFWQHQGEGLAVFASSEAMRVIRLAGDPGRRVSVADAPHLVPLVEAVDHHGPFYLLALALGEVRLFAGSWSALEPLDLGPIPASVEDMERRHETEPELQHQHTPASRGTATFHGHGGREISDVVLGKFIAEVAAGVRRRIGAASQAPVYLAAVEEYLPRLRSTGQIPTLRPAVITGSPEGTPGHELFERVRPLIAADRAARDARLREALDSAAGRRRLATSQEVMSVAAEGRVDTLVLDPEVIDAPEADLDRAVMQTLTEGGGVHTLTALPDGAPAAAILRY